MRKRMGARLRIRKAVRAPGGGWHGQERQGAMNNERGIALLIVLTVITLLTIAVVEFTYTVQLDQHRARNSVSALQAQLLARSGINLAESFLAQDEDATFDAFTEEWWLNLGVFCEGLELAPTMRVKCDVEDESGKININLTKPVGQPPAAQPNQPTYTKDAFLRDALRQIFEAYGVEVEIVDRIEEYWMLEPEPDSQGRTRGPDLFHSLEGFAAEFEILPEKLPRLRRLLTATANFWRAVRRDRCVSSRSFTTP